MGDLDKTGLGGDLDKAFDLTVANLRPDSDDARDLGNATFEWKDLYVDGNVYIDRAVDIGGVACENRQIYPAGTNSSVGKVGNPFGAAYIYQKGVNTVEAVTLGGGVVTFATGRDVMAITGDVGGNVIATITGGITGQVLVLIFVDAKVQITDTDAHTANTVDLSAAFTSADDTVLTLVFDGTSWYEVSRSVN